MMGSAFDTLPDAAARRRALLDHDSTLLVEAGAGSGKTALMAGRIALLLASGVPAREIVAITFTEAASSELLERIERYLPLLAQGLVPDELRLALPEGLSAEQAKAIAVAADSIDEITCTTIHGFCQQLVKPYPVETGIDPWGRHHRSGGRRSRLSGSCPGLAVGALRPRPRRRGTGPLAAAAETRHR